MNEYERRLACNRLTVLIKLEAISEARLLAILEYRE